MTIQSAWAVLLAIVISMVPTTSFAQRATPLEATVLVRLLGHVRVLRGEDERAWRERLLDLREVEVGIGSGFIVSPEGWVITNHHVVSSEKSTVIVQGQKLEVSIDITGIEVVLPADARQPVRRYAATVHVADTEHDLALLRISGADFPYLGLGDSNAVSAGDAVRAIGYPFGDMLELDKPKAAHAIPNPSVTTGAISALRGDAAGEQRYLQVSTVLNPGNSGGPIADEEGYVVGVAQSRLRAASAIGFAVPINRVKRFLQAHGLESILPVTVLLPGGSIASTRKGISLAVPIGFEDRSPVRLRIEATSDARTSRVTDASTEHLVLHIDRIATTHSREQLERTLLTAGTFEQFQMSGIPTRTAARNDAGSRALSGSVGGTDRRGQPTKMVYSIVDLGKEKLVARYIGAADTVAVNRSILQESLQTLEAGPLITAEVTNTLHPTLVASPSVPLAIVEGWAIESGQPWQCAPQLPPSTSSFSMSPPGDFTIALRAAWHPAPAQAAGAAARACSPDATTFGEGSYAASAPAWGISYQLVGVFIPVSGGLWHLEMIAPADKTRFVGAAFGAWVKSAAPP